MRKLKYKAKKCFHCDKKLEKGETPYLIGVDNPYINLPFHKDCMQKVINFGEEKYLQENKKKIIEWSKEE